MDDAVVSIADVSQPLHDRHRALRRPSRHRPQHDARRTLGSFSLNNTGRRAKWCLVGWRAGVGQRRTGGAADGDLLLARQRSRDSGRPADAHGRPTTSKVPVNDAHRHRARVVERERRHQATVRDALSRDARRCRARVWTGLRGAADGVARWSTTRWDASRRSGGAIAAGRGQHHHHLGSRPRAGRAGKHRRHRGHGRSARRRGGDDRAVRRLHAAARPRARGIRPARRRARSLRVLAEGGPPETLALRNAIRACRPSCVRCRKAGMPGRARRSAKRPPGATRGSHGFDPALPSMRDDLHRPRPVVPTGPGRARRSTTSTSTRC